MSATVANYLSDASPLILSPAAPPRNMSASIDYSFPMASPRSLSTATSSDEMPTNSKTSLETRANSITTISPTGGYLNLGDFEQPNSGHGSPANGHSQPPLIPSTLSPTTFGMTDGDQSLPNAGNLAENLRYEQHPFLCLEAQKADRATSEPNGSVESDCHRFT